MLQKFEDWVPGKGHTVSIMDESGHKPLTSIIHWRRLQVSSLFRETVLNTHSRFSHSSIFLSRSLSVCALPYIPMLVRSIFLAFPLSLFWCVGTLRACAHQKKFGEDGRRDWKRERSYMHSYEMGHIESEIGVRDGRQQNRVDSFSRRTRGSMISKTTKSGCAHLPAINVYKHLTLWESK